MITTLLNIENVATMVCRVPGKEELGGASVGLESWDMDERSEEHTSELQSHSDLVCRLLFETKKHTSELQSHSDIVCRLLLEKKNDPVQPAPRCAPTFCIFALPTLPSSTSRCSAPSPWL